LRPDGDLNLFKAALICSGLRCGIRDDVVAPMISSLTKCKRWIECSYRETTLPCKTLLEKASLSSVRAMPFHNFTCCIYVCSKLQTVPRAEL
jgi:hypothetical protein